MARFDVVNDEYMGFIKALREQVRDPNVISHGRPVLPSQKDEDTHIDVKLQEGCSEKGVARIRQHDLKLIGYQQQPGGNWLEISEFELYDDKSRLDVRGVKLCLGPSTLVKAVNILLDERTRDLTDPKQKEVARIALLELDILLCEATKLDAILVWLDAAFKSGVEVPLHPLMLDLIVEWENLSRELLAPYHDAAALCNYYLPNHDHERHNWTRIVGVTCQDLARSLGILRAAGEEDSLMADALIAGDCLAEIHSILVFFGKGKQGSVYGAVRLTDGLHTYNIYQRDATQCETIESNDTLSLEGPSGLVVALDFLEVELDLMERDGNLQVSKGKFFLHSQQVESENLYDKRLSAIIRGTDGYAVVFCTVFTSAVHAVVEVALVPKQGGQDHRHVCLCGKVFAHSLEFAYCFEHEQKYSEIKLFHKPVQQLNEASGSQCIGAHCKRGEIVELGVPIRLARTAVNVPTHGSLVLGASLKDCLGNSIASGVLNLKPQGRGTSGGVIGQCEEVYELHVNVSWRTW